MEKIIQPPMAHDRCTKIISMIKWIRSSILSIKNSLAAGGGWRGRRGFPPLAGALSGGGGVSQAHAPDSLRSPPPLAQASFPQAPSPKPQAPRPKPQVPSPKPHTSLPTASGLLPGVSDQTLLRNSDALIRGGYFPRAADPLCTRFPRAYG